MNFVEDLIAKIAVGLLAAVALTGLASLNARFRALIKSISPYPWAVALLAAVPASIITAAGVIFIDKSFSDHPVPLTKEEIAFVIKAEIAKLPAPLTLADLDGEIAKHPGQKGDKGNPGDPGHNGAPGAPGAPALAPIGAVVAFAPGAPDVSDDTCPSGWSPFRDTRGRFIVGAGTTSDTWARVGTDQRMRIALTNYDSGKKRRRGKPHPDHPRNAAA